MKFTLEIRIFCKKSLALMCHHTWVLLSNPIVMKTDQLYTETYCRTVDVDVFTTLRNIYNGSFCENSNRLKAANYFPKMFHHRCLAGS